MSDVLSMQGLRQLVEAFGQKNVDEVIERSRVINDVDKRSFNYSIEEPILRHYGSYFAIDRPWSFTTIQPAIRAADFDRLLSGERNRLSVFDIAALCYRFEPDPTQICDLQRRGICELMDFLTTKVGLDRNRLYVTYYNGGTIKAASDGRVDVNRFFPRDTTTYDTLRSIGFSPNQVRGITSLDTLLVTFPAKTEFWAGYRFEVFYRFDQSHEVEIGTGEALAFKRVVSRAGDILDVVPAPACLVACVVGMERVLMAANGCSDPFACDHIKPLIDCVIAASGVPDDHAARVLVDAVRALHLCAADEFGFTKLPSRHVKQEYSSYCGRLLQSASALALDSLQQQAIVSVNAEAQPWYGELRGACGRVSSELLFYRERRDKAERRGAKHPE